MSSPDVADDVPTHFAVGSLYSNEQIYRGLGIGNAGGVRVRMGLGQAVRRAALFTAIPTPRQALENPYHDRLEGDTLVYTGAGLQGNQVLSGINARLFQQAEQVFPIFGFAQVSSRRSQQHDNKRWQFLGLLDFQRHYSEVQLDAQGRNRNAWVFEFLVHTEPQAIEVSEDLEAAQAIRASRGGLLSANDRELDDRPLTAEPCVETPDFGLLEGIRRRLLGMEARTFEWFIGDLLKASGFSSVEVTRFSQDGGIDVQARPSSNLWPIHHLLLQVQAKRWLHTVGRKEVAELRGSMQPHAAGCIVTTSHFSRAALIEAQEPGKVPIQAINGLELATWVHAVGYDLRK